MKKGVVATSSDSETRVGRKFNEHDEVGRLTTVILPEVEHPDTGTPIRSRYEYAVFRKSLL